MRKEKRIKKLGEWTNVPFAEWKNEICTGMDTNRWVDMMVFSHWFLIEGNLVISSKNREGSTGGFRSDKRHEIFFLDSKGRNCA